MSRRLNFCHASPSIRGPWAQTQRRGHLEPTAPLPTGTRAPSCGPHLVGPPSACEDGPGGVCVTKTKPEPRSGPPERTQGTGVPGTRELPAPTPQLCGVCASPLCPPLPPSRPSLPPLHGLGAPPAVCTVAGQAPHMGPAPRLPRSASAMAPGPGTACPSRAVMWTHRAFPRRAAPWQVLSSPVPQKLLLPSTQRSGRSPTAGSAPVLLPVSVPHIPGTKRGTSPLGGRAGWGWRRGPCIVRLHTDPPRPKPGSWVPPCPGGQAWDCAQLGCVLQQMGRARDPGSHTGPLRRHVLWRACVQTDLPFPQALDAHSTHRECTLGQKACTRKPFFKIKYTCLFEGDMRAHCKTMLGADSKTRGRVLELEAGGGDVGQI